jgi:putative FmdB family regulatory protein
MPIYEYYCAHCDKAFEMMQGFSEAPLSSCPSCGNPVEKKIHPPGVVFKGGGFYKTDSRKAPAESADKPAKKE